jgi:sn1-specific diacylglycerol lipase
MSHPSLSTAGIESKDGAQTNISKRERLSSQHPRELYLVAEGARFMPLAQAIYTWVSFLQEYPVGGVCGLGYRILRRCACCSPQDNISGDYRWQPHTVALQAIAGLDEGDIIYASFKQSITAIPYMITLDHEWKSVVVSIRGTLSMESLLADMTFRPEPLEKFGEECGFDGKDRYCHAGMLACTEWIYRDLKR